MSSLHNYPHSTYPSQRKFQHLSSPRSTSMYESLPTRERDSESCLPRSRSNQSLNVNQRLPSSISSSSKLGSYKTRLPVVKGPRAHLKPPRSRAITLSYRELKSTPRIHSPTSRDSVPPSLLTSHGMLEPYSRSLSPSFLDLTPSPEYDPLPSAPPAPTMTSTSRAKRKGRPPPLVLRDSFHFTGSQSPTFPTPVNDVKAAHLTPLSPFTPISPRYRMPSEKERLRRRLLKLQRTLGEQITPALVARPKPSPQTTDNSKRESTFIKPYQRDGVSLDETLDHFPLCGLTAPDLFGPDSNFLNNLPFTHKRHSSGPTPSSPSVLSLRHCIPETAALSPMTFTAFAESATPKTSSFVLRKNNQDSSSEDDDDDYDTLPASPFDDDSSYKSESDYTRSHTDEINTSLVNLPYMPYLASDRTGHSNTPNTPGIRRKEHRHGWSGEWNQPHIQDVIEKLRIL